MGEINTVEINKRYFVYFGGFFFLHILKVKLIEKIQIFFLRISIDKCKRTNRISSNT